MNPHVKVQVFDLTRSIMASSPLKKKSSSGRYFVSFFILIDTRQLSKENELSPLFHLYRAILCNAIPLAHDTMESSLYIPTLWPMTPWKVCFMFRHSNMK
ncbi:hypothetical protein BT93_F1372 [Corymbia citriodora subsp. variegata]|nr:hypothetical protein BT93_F1372 [Corymbia citriodora subsp. variegata]